MNNYCRNCGNKLQENSKFCNYCGIKNIEKRINKKKAISFKKKEKICILIVVISFILFPILSLANAFLDISNLFLSILCPILFIGAYITLVYAKIYLKESKVLSILYIIGTTLLSIIIFFYLVYLFIRYTV